jgi:hypothetical protein
VSILDVSAKDIVRLSDDVQAELLRRLIEAEASANAIPLNAVIHGGHDNAPDRGIDARVSWSGGPDRTGFFPRRTTIFQSKAETMSARRLKDEMAPGGVPRPLFEEFAEEDGAYVMFCGKDNCTEGMLRDRLIAMRSALSKVSQSDRLALDFYDASRIARWVNTHAGVAAWLRDSLGRPLQGWRPYEPWSHPGASEHLPYLTDEASRAGFAFDEEAPHVRILDALARVRSELARAGRSVRLVGLSGTGKTRFAEALFDDAVGNKALPRSHVIYGDVASVEVSPITVAEQLIAEGRRAIVIADNCPATVHRRVTNIISRPNSQISFLSIDYDVGEDQPESTLVVVLKEDSDELIRALLNQRAPGLPATDRDRIVDFSGGNSRIALVLVRSAEAAGSLANLADRELVRRLFQDDRQPASDMLIRCAEAASLVIQYSVEPSEERIDPEYHHLARLAGVSPEDMYRATSEFLDRGVGQQRGRWRAVLPHALAARLARQALERVSRRQLYEAFAERAPRRLALSFARRLGQIDDHEEAQALARIFLAQDGPVGVVSADDECGLGMLQALAPAAQEAALDVVERSLEADEAGALIRDRSTTRYWIATLLMHLAYKRELFDRAALLLARVVKDEDKNNNVHNVRNLFEQLFWMVMSGTLAEPDQRLDFVEDLLVSNDDNARLLGIDALDAALKASAFVSSTDVTKFGGQARSLGWHPETNEQIERMFARAARRLTTLAVLDGLSAERARTALANRVRELTEERFIHILEVVAHAVRGRGFWAVGWREICMRLHFNRQDMNNELRDRLDQLEYLLSPKTLDERFKAFVLHPNWEFYTPAPKHEEDRNVDVRSEIERIALELKGEHVCLRGYIECATSPGRGEAALFGESLVAAGFDVSNLYGMGIEAWGAVSPQSRQAGFLFGVLVGTAKRDVEKAEGMLDRIAGHESLSAELVLFSHAVRPLSPQSLQRITHSLRAGQVQPGSLVGLAGAAARREVPQAELATLLRELVERGQEGNAAAAHILANFQLSQEGGIDQLSPDLWAIGRRVVESEHLFAHCDLSRSYMAKVLAEAVLDHEGDPQLASTIVRNTRLAVEGGVRGDESLKDVMRFVARRYPEVFLSDVMLHGRTESAPWRFFTDHDDSDVRPSRHPIDYVDPPRLLEWVKVDPRGRAGQVAQVLTFATTNNGSGEMIWTPVALDLISIEETAVQVLKHFEQRFYLGGWTGSEAHRYARRRSLCEALRDHPNPSVRRWAREAPIRMEQAIRSAEERERARNQSFE